ncbi:MAG: hypothetical protein ACOH2V_00105 [Candidatus Saccharimonadaceae bacterium]
MTARQVFEYALIEVNKSQAASLLLEDYNYFMNKGINQHINKIYNFYDMNQQKTDDLRVLKSTAVLIPTLAENYQDMKLYSTVYNTILPDDYLHILNCIVEYTVRSTFKCYNQNDKVHFGAKRLTADMFSQVINNYYMRPSYKTPYFFINNFTTKNDYKTQDNQTDIIYTSLGNPDENVEKIQGVRYGNKSNIRMEIRYGKDNTLFVLDKVYIDYIRTPQFVRLTQSQVDNVADDSQVLEFPDYVCQEITNELIKLLLEHGSDPRLQTQIPISQSIANPAQEQPKR